MYARRKVSPGLVLRLTWHYLLFSAGWSTLVVYLHEVVGLKFFTLPFLPIATIGTAVAFLVGLKNNKSYDRLWEARKIWGGIVNETQAWGDQVLNFILAADDSDEQQIRTAQRELIDGQLAWINALRIQLRRPSPFGPRPRFLQEHQVVLGQDWDGELQRFLDPASLKEVSGYKNPARQLLRRQGMLLRKCFQRGWIHEYRYVEMMRILRKCHILHGSSERIKNTPFPRQFAYFSQLFTRIFMILLPLGLLDGFREEATRNLVTHWGQVEYVFFLVPLSTLVAWIFAILESMGNRSEDPFECGIFDVPLTTLCRTVEIELREMLGDKELPPPVQPVDDVLY